MIAASKIINVSGSNNRSPLTFPPGIVVMRGNHYVSETSTNIFYCFPNITSSG